MNARRMSGIGAAAMLVTACGATATVRYVDDSAPAGGNGASWSTAYNSLSTALQAAVAGDEIRVGQGTYRPGSLRTSTFTLKDGVAVRGGYAGYTGVNPNARDPKVFVSTLSGDVGSNDGVNSANTSDNCYQVVTAPSNVSASTIVEGLVITGGNADGAFGVQDRGGGMNCMGSPQIVSCVFRANIGSGAGAMCVGSTANPSIRSCVFFGNRATGVTSFTSGGAVHVGGNAELASCFFAGNSSVGNGGAVSIATNATNTKVYGCVFSANSAANGGGLQAGPGPVTNCSFSRNLATASGGAINVSPTNSPAITNCILWDNVAATGGREVNGSAVMTYCCIKDGAEGAGNIDMDPLFIDPAGPDHVFGTADDDLHIAGGPVFYSPCIDAGNSVPAMQVVLTDFDGQARFADHPFVSNTGVGPGDPVDLGAFESKPRVCNVDFNVDGEVNADDLGDFITAYFTGCQ